MPEKPQQILEVLRKGFHLAKSGRPGPVFINLPLNLFGKEVSNIPEKIDRKKTRIKKEEVAKVARLLTSSKNPLIWAGEGVMRAQAVSLLSELATLLEIPVMTNLSGRGAFDETNSLSLRIPIFDLPLDILKGADLILAIGVKLTSMNTRNYALPLPKNLIQIDIEPEKRCGYRKKLEIKACPQQFLAELLEELKGKVKKEKGKNIIVNTFKTALKDYQDYFEPIASKEVSPVMPPRFFKELVAYLDHKEFIYVVDSVWGVHCYHSPAISVKDLHITLGSFGCLGLALPAAIGAAIAAPDKLIISLSGDGSFLFNCQELSTAADLNLKNLIQIVFVNNGYGSLNHLQNFLCGGRNFAVDWRAIDYVKLAQGMGAEGFLIREPQQIEKTFAQAERIDGPTLIAVETENIPTMPESTYKRLLKG
jgi:acetolactate synthase-1/2/3 large subunit